MDIDTTMFTTTKNYGGHGTGPATSLLESEFYLTRVKRLSVVLCIHCNQNKLFNLELVSKEDIRSHFMLHIMLGHKPLGSLGMDGEIQKLCLDPK